MLKYASKFFLNIFLSVLATVIGSYLANQYIARRPAAEAPVSLDATIDPKGPDANAASREADITASEGPAAVANALEPAGAIGGHGVDKINYEKAVPPVDRLAESTNVPARQHRSAPRHKQISKTHTAATPESASLTVAPPELGRATTGRFFNTSANSALDASPPQEVGQDDDVSPPPDPEMTGSHIAGGVLKPIIRTALLLLEPPSRALRFSCSRIAAISLSLMTCPRCWLNRNDQRMSVYVVAYPRNQTSGSDDEKARPPAGFFIA
jgi:hypothetical protein